MLEYAARRFDGTAELVREPDGQAWVRIGVASARAPERELVGDALFEGGVALIATEHREQTLRGQMA